MKTPTLLTSCLVSVALGLTVGTACPRASAASTLDPDVTWAETFDTPAVSAHVAAHGADVVILAVGAGSNVRREVGRALQSQLESGGTAGKVTLVEATKKEQGLADAELVARHAEDGAERLVVVRVDDERATVSVYSSEGDAVGGFSIERGEAVPAAPESSSIDGGALVLVDGEVSAEDDEALAEYERRRIVFGGSLNVTATSSTTAVISRTFEPHTGAGAPLPEDEFYSYVGRHDLAKKYRVRRATRLGLVSVGGVAILTGTVLMVALPLAALVGGDDCTDVEDSMMAACTAAADARKKKQRRIGLGAGGGLLGGGIVLTIVGGRIKPHTITAAQAQEMGEEYNRNLRKELGLEKVADVRVGISADRSSGGVVLSGRF